MATIFEYLPENTLFVVEDPEAVLDQARRQGSKLRETAAARQAEHRLALPAEEFVALEDEARAALEGRPRVELHPVEVVRLDASPDAPPRVHLRAEPNTTLRAELA